jgi:hypothetical protein
MGHACRIARRENRERYLIPVIVGHPVPPDDRLRSSERRDFPPVEHVARLAYSFWEARGRLPGSALEDWLRAERELKGGA